MTTLPSCDAVIGADVIKTLGLDGSGTTRGSEKRSGRFPKAELQFVELPGKDTSYASMERGHATQKLPLRVIVAETVFVVALYTTVVT
jgi:hypothetical protein